MTWRENKRMILEEKREYLKTDLSMLKEREQHLEAEQDEDDDMKVVGELLDIEFEEADLEQKLKETEMYIEDLK